MEEGTKGTEGEMLCNSILNKAQFLKGLSLKSECNLKKTALSVSPKLCPQNAVSCFLGKYREEAEYRWALLSEGDFTSKLCSLNAWLSVLH